MGVQYIIYLNIPINPLTDYGYINYILNRLFSSELFSQIYKIYYVLITSSSSSENTNNFLSSFAKENKNEAEADFKEKLRNADQKEQPDYLYKMEFLVNVETSFDNTVPIMSEIYYNIAKNSNCFYNILFINFSPFFSEKNTITDPDVLKNWMNYLIYFYITNANECIGGLSSSNVVGVDLIESSPYSYYLSDWWWTNSIYIKTLKYSNKKSTPFITNGTEGGLYVSIWKSINWITEPELAKNYTSKYYENKDIELEYVSVDNGYAYVKNPLCFKPILDDKFHLDDSLTSRLIFSLNIYNDPNDIPKIKYTRPEISQCEHRDKLLRWNRPKSKVKTQQEIQVFPSFYKRG
jgi:hypothetical protein